jgi:hypothetical protein
VREAALHAAWPGLHGSGDGSRRYLAGELSRGPDLERVCPVRAPALPLTRSPPAIAPPDDQHEELIGADQRDRGLRGHGSTDQAASGPRSLALPAVRVGCHRQKIKRL